MYTPKEEPSEFEHGEPAAYEWDDDQEWDDQEQTTSTPTKCKCMDSSDGLDYTVAGISEIVH